MSHDAPVLVVAQRLAVASLTGLAIGVEREWSGHARGPDARFAGVRTFLLLGLIGGIAGWLATEELQLIAAELLLAASALTVVAYAVAAQRITGSVDGTTEVAALAVLGTGFAAGIGYDALAGGVAAAIVLVLAEKTRIHGLLDHIDEVELNAALQFAALALIVLPLLPEGPFGPWGGIRPRGLWMIVLIFTALNFLGFIARRAVGAERGYGVTGLIGGVISSTAVTLDFARTNRGDRTVGDALAVGVVGACTVLLPRVTIVSAMLNPDVALLLIPYLLPALVIGAVMVGLALRRPAGAAHAAPEIGSPLRLLSAIQMALLFQVALTASTMAARYWGSRGVISSAVVLGLTDVDALTVSMNHLGASAGMVSLAARAIAVGVLTNTIFKASIALVIGNGRFRRLALGGLAVLAAASVLGLWIGARFYG